MKVLVTGGAGFIGTHICWRLARAGHHVEILDDFSAGQDAPDGFPLRISRLQSLDAGTLADFDAIVHSAARADISRNWESREQRELLLSTNVFGTINILEAKRPDAQLIFLSTCGIYGDTAHGKETDKTAITSPYSASKLAGEAYVEAYATAQGFPWWALRLSCAVGHGYHHGHIADFVRMAKAGCIHAKNDGVTRKSFVHVLDIADACTRLLEKPDVLSGVYNVTGGEWSWRDTVSVMGAITEKYIPVEAASRTHGWIGDPMAVVSGEKLAPYYRPHRSIEAGVREALWSLGWTGAEGADGTHEDYP